MCYSIIQNSFIFAEFCEQSLFTVLRYEIKYYVPYTKLSLLRSMVTPFMEIDPNARERGEYTVRSIYYDTPDFECYITKKAGEKHRNKVRLRGYDIAGDEGVVFMEIKKKFEDPIFKNRALMNFGIAKKIIAGAPIEHFLDNKKKDAEDNARRFMYNVHARKMMPVVCVIYEREPYLAKFPDPENNLRITFDKNLRGVPYPTINELYSERDVKPACEGYFILEVKYNQKYPAWMRTVISTLGLKREAASKYCLCIEAHPDKIDTMKRYDTLRNARMFDYISAGNDGY